MLHRIVAIVEGHGDEPAVPVLIRRIAAEVNPGLAVEVHPIRIPFSRLVRQGEFERAVDLAARMSGANDSILILVDCEDDCPAELGPRLLARARQARADRQIGVVLAKCEYETWFIASAESLRGKRGLPNDLTSPEHPESIRGAKEWLERHMPPRRGYSEPLDQPALTACFDMRAARKADSFDKCYREIAKLLQQASNPKKRSSR